MLDESLLSVRTRAIEVSGVRKVFELGRSLKNPVNLSIGQPHFPVPDAIKRAAHTAIDADQNGYTVTQGIPELRAKLSADVQTRFPGQNREVLVTSGTSGGLLLALLAVVNPGDEVITTDPYFVAYPNLVTIAGGKLITIPNYPDFRVDVNRVAEAITPRTKAMMFSSPSNPTGAVLDADTQRDLAQLARERGILLISDEIYRAFHYDGTATTPANSDPNVLVIEGFGKTYGITGWRLGWAHGPKWLLQEMTKLQQFTFVCAPSIVQHAGVTAMDFDPTAIVAEYKHKRDMLVNGLRGVYDFTVPGGAFYLFPKAPWGTGTEFVTEAIQRNLLVIPGNSFSKHDTHFRVSYAASNETLERGIELLLQLAKRG